MITYGVSAYADRGLINIESRWVPGDDEQKYNHHMKKNRALMEFNGWDGPKSEFTYRFNSHGFRADEFTDEPSVMFLGCSMTMGIGTELEKTWAHMVARDMGLKNHNLATGGSSNDACFRLFNHWHRIHKPSVVIHYTPPHHRLEVINPNNKIKNYLPFGQAIQGSSFYGEWIANDLNGELNHQKNVLAIEYLCKQSNIPYLHLDHNQMFVIEEGFEYIENEYGRDLLHPGESWHRNMHKKVLRKYFTSRSQGGSLDIDLG